MHHFSPWNVDDDGEPVTSTDLDESGYSTGLGVALFGLFNQERFLQLLRSFTAFDEGADGLVKRIAKPHQYFAVSKAVGSTVTAVESNGKAGVVWHTQGSGKSMEMELYANLVIRHPKLLNPTIVVITDRNELDGQLCQTFAQSQLLGEQPQQIRRRAELRDEIANRTTGGIYFTTLQKFGRSRDEREAGAEHPLLSDRRNIIVVVDEAHRSHYDDLDGYARHLKDALPHATLIAFTGTPVSFEDRNTRDVFGDYIDIYDLTRAVADGATVPVVFQPRLIKIGLTADVTEEDLDAAADEATTGLDDAERSRIERGVLAINAIYGAPARLAALTEDVVAQWEGRRERMRPFLDAPGQGDDRLRHPRDLRQPLLRGRRAAARLALRRPGQGCDQGRLLRRSVRRAAGDRPRAAGLAERGDQAAAPRRGRRAGDRDRQGHDAHRVRLAAAAYPLPRPPAQGCAADADAGAGQPHLPRQGRRAARRLRATGRQLDEGAVGVPRADQERKPLGRDAEEAVALTADLLGALGDLLSDCDWRAVLHGGSKRPFLQAAHRAVNYLRDPATPGNQVPEGEETVAARYRKLSGQLARAWAISGGDEQLAQRPDAQFYEEVRVWMAKYDAAQRQASGAPLPDDIRRLLNQLVAESTASGDVVDIYDAAGMPRPTLDDLTPTFLAHTQRASNPHLAIEALRAMLTEESTRATGGNVVRRRAFSDRIAELMRRYTNQQLTSAEVIAELIELAREVAAECNRGARFSPPLTGDELAFFDAVATNESAVAEQGDDILAQIARELVEVMRRDVRTDWTVRDNVRAKLRSSIRRLLVKHRYPPDKQPVAIKLVLEQMEAMAPRYAAERA